MGNGYHFENAGSATAGNNPVQSVDWYDCVAWCNARSQQAGLTPCYYTDAGFTRVYTNATGTSVYLNTANNGYRLPTEAEWEKAARGGLTGNRFPWGNIITESQANYYALPTSYSYDLGPYSGYNTNFDSGSAYTSPVGSFAPNAYGLYDMTGNVREWCWDWYAAPPYPAGSAYLGGTNPTGAGARIGLPGVARQLLERPRLKLAVRLSLHRQPELRRRSRWVSVCAGALVFVLLRSNPFELVRVNSCRP